MKYTLEKKAYEMGPSLYVKEYLNNLNHLELLTEKKLFRMRRHVVDHQQSR
jgi:hypothetical protein